MCLDDVQLPTTTRFVTKKYAKQVQEQFAYIAIGSSSSQCSACGGNASPSDMNTHVHGGPRSGYVEGSRLTDENGCGVTWMRRVPMYLGATRDGNNWDDMSKPFFKERSEQEEEEG
jgi:hypothetical protein